MQLNTIKPAVGSKTKRVRVGRGVGSGIGKTNGRSRQHDHHESCAEAVANPPRQAQTDRGLPLEKIAQTASNQADQASD